MKNLKWKDGLEGHLRAQTTLMGIICKKNKAINRLYRNQTVISHLNKLRQRFIWWAGWVREFVLLVKVSKVSVGHQCEQGEYLLLNLSEKNILMSAEAEQGSVS